MQDGWECVSGDAVPGALSLSVENSSIILPPLATTAVVFQHLLPLVFGTPVSTAGGTGPPLIFLSAL
jgi:hypothetical protein